MIFKIPDVLSLLFMQFYRRIERLNDIILIYLPKFKALRHRNVVQRKTCFRQLNQFRCTVDFSGVQCICQIRPGAEIVNSIRYCFLLSRVQMKNRRTPAFLPGCSPVLPFHRIKSLSVFMPLSALFPHCCTPSRKTAPAN